MDFTKEFIIHELQELLPYDIYIFFNTSKNYQKLYKERVISKYWCFNEKYSFKYLNDEIVTGKIHEPSWLSCLLFPKKIHINQSFNEYINSRIDTQKLLSIKITKNCEVDDKNIYLLGKVHSLDLSYCRKITDEGFVHLAQIHTLNLRNCNITDEGVKYLGKVHTLNLRNCKKLIKGSEHLGNVHTLDLYDCNITDECVKHLGNVHTLNLGFCCNISDEGIKHLGRVNTLELNSCHGVTNEGIKYLGRVHKLDLTSCRNITDVGIQHLGKVHTLSCSNVTNKGIKFLGNCHTLILNDSNIADISILSGVHTLILKNLTNVPKGINNLHNKNLCINVNERLKNLSVEFFVNERVEYYSLNMSHCSTILNSSLKYLGNIHSLNLSFCCKVSDEGLKYLGNCHKLNLYGCYDITNEGLKHLQNVKMIFLDISFTKNITNDCLIDLGNVFVKNEDNHDMWTPYKRKGGNVFW